MLFFFNFFFTLRIWFLKSWPSYLALMGLRYQTPLYQPSEKRICYQIIFIINFEEVQGRFRVKGLVFEMFRIIIVFQFFFIPSFRVWDTYRFFFMENTRLTCKSHKRKITLGFGTLRKSKNYFSGGWFNFGQKLTSLPCMHANFGCNGPTPSSLNSSILLGHDGNITVQNISKSTPGNFKK